MAPSSDTADGVHPVRLDGPVVALRELDERDLDALFEIFSDPEVIRYLPLDPVTYEGEQEWLAETMAAARQHPRTQYHLAIEERSTGALAGSIRLAIDRPEDLSADIGYALGRRWWGRGMGTQAVGLVLRFGFGSLGLHRIWATHHPDNPASGRVLVKAGMQYEGRIRDHMLVRGAWRDSLMYGAVCTDRSRW